MARNINPINKPADIATAGNGRIARELMTQTNGAFLGHRLFARAWAALDAHIQMHTGVDVRFTGVYRSYDQQRSLFLQRYDDTGSASVTVAKARAVGKPLKFWSAALGGTGTYWAHVTGATAATPGTSNHGWGLAADMHTGDIPAGGPVLTLLEQPQPGGGTYAQLFGFSWEAGIQASEPWHLRYFTGDTVPQHVLDWEASQAPAPAPSPIPPPNLPAGMETWMRDYLVWFSNTTTYPSANKPPQQIGASGPKEFVQYLQIVCRFVAGQAIAIDGNFGARTEGAVRNVQAYFKLTVDGKVGPKTWGTLDWIATTYKNEHGW
jgi:Putative peptidoglycan binding domain/D-alanyl-D-alanine carboxypeptidase